MKKLLSPLVLFVLLSGCSFSTNVSMDNKGVVTGAAVFSVPKSVLPKVTSVSEWDKILSNNNFPSPDPTSSASATCESGEDVINNLWTYACGIVGDASAIANATEASTAVSMAAVREGSTLTLTILPGDGSSTQSGLGLNGVSLMSVTNRITLPGVVQSVSPGVTKIDSHTVSFTTDENQQDELTATYTLTNAPTGSAKVTLGANASLDKSTNRRQVELSAEIMGKVPGKVIFYDGAMLFGKAEVDPSTGVATSIQANPAAGIHNYRAVFTPQDWWNYVSTSDSLSKNLIFFRIQKSSVISGTPRVGALLKINPGQWVPNSANVTYQWLRNSRPIPKAEKSTYRVQKTDVGTSISVVICLSKSGVVDGMFTTPKVKILK